MIMWVSNYRCSISTFCNWIPMFFACQLLPSQCFGQCSKTSRSAIDVTFRPNFTISKLIYWLPKWARSCSFVHLGLKRIFQNLFWPTMSLVWARWQDIDFNHFLLVYGPLCKNGCKVIIQPSQPHAWSITHVYISFVAIR